MTAGCYPRPLQTALDDTLGAASGIKVDLLEAPSDDRVQSSGVIGHVRVLGSSADPRPLYDASASAPDISILAPDDRYLWVQAESCRCKKGRVVRQLTYSEVLSLWDYEGKLESRHWPPEVRYEVLHRRLQSPPAKLVRALVFEAGEQLSGDAGSAQLPPSPPGPIGKTRDIPFNSPLEIKGGARVAVATADDVEADLNIRAPANETSAEAHARQVLRRFAARWWAKHQERLATSWLKEHGTDKDAAAIADCIRRIREVTYFQWRRGSSLFFWKFPDEWREDARDGVRFWHLSKPPKGFMRNHPCETREAELATCLKLFKLKFKWYIEHGRVDLVIPRFAVVKVEVAGKVVDIRVVWDCRTNGHNETLWAPGFRLPVFQDMADLVVKWLSCAVGEYLELGSPIQDYTQDATTFIKSFQADIDVGEMFHNFKAHEEERSSLGVRYTMTKGEGQVETDEFMRFVCLNFGNLSSPYLAGQGQARIGEICQGDNTDSSNPFAWKRVRRNLPASAGYDPSMPRLMLLRANGELATRWATYVDDTRLGNRGRAPDRRAARTLCARMNSLGNQADARKFQPESLTPGPWQGEIIHTDSPFSMKSTTGKKWTRLRTGLEWLRSQADTPGFVETGELRRIAGLGVNVTEVYPEGRCFLKGFFNALEAFRGDRDPDGWRLQGLMDAARIVELTDAPPAQAREGYPYTTRITDQLKMHVDALLELFPTDVPLALPVRPTDKHKLRYVCGDASAEGLSWGTQYPDGALEGRDGLWAPDFALGGSNLREAQNQVNHLLTDIRADKHDGCEVWCATDNAVWSAVWHKGMSSAKHLFRLVLDLKLECRTHEV